MVKTFRIIRWLIIILVPLSMFGCKAVKSQAKVAVAELGLSMKLPSGWEADKQNPRMFYETKNRDDNFGMVEDYPLEGKSLNEYVEYMLPAGAPNRIISKTPITINGYEAIEVVSEAEYTVIDVNILKNDRIVRVSFRTLREDFPKHEPSLRTSLQSIKVGEG